MNMKFEKLNSLGMTADFSACTSELLQCFGYKGSLQQALSLPLPDFHGDVDLVRDNYFVYNLLRKSSPVNMSVDSQRELEYTTFNKWMEVEQKCEVSNNRFALGAIKHHGVLHTLVEDIRREIARILGPLDRCTIEQLPSYAKITSGATTTHRRNKGDAYYKLTEPLGVTEKAQNFALVLMATDHHWRETMLTKVSDWPYSWLSIQTGARWGTVPKDWKILRTIGIQPTGNQIWQSALGGLIRDRLRRTGINLDTVWRENQRLAYQASRDRDHATIDSSSASALYSRRLVETLVDPEWFTVLDLFRCDLIEVPKSSAERFGVRHFEHIDGRYYRRSAGFMDMGVGYCFELQSVVFLAMGRAVCRYLGLSPATVSIFGDDLIVPSAAVSKLQEVFEYFGFEMNANKSFWGDHPFRESCGVHYLDGTDIQPIYRKEQSGHSIVDWLWLLNSIRLHWSYSSKKAVRRWYTRWRTHACGRFGTILGVPVSDLCVPPSFGLVSGWVELEPRVSHSYLRTTYYQVTSLSEVSRKHEFDGHSALHAYLFPRGEGKPLDSRYNRDLPTDVGLGKNYLFDQTALSAAEIIRYQTCPHVASNSLIKLVNEESETRRRAAYVRAIRTGKIVPKSWHIGWWD